MSPDADVPPLARPFFFDGQRLTATDLSATQAFHRELRWLHNRSLHTWGIAVGLAVTGERGDREVVVRAGYALDCTGRDLVVPAAMTIPVPPVAGKDGKPAFFYLTASYADDHDIPPSETRAGVCDGAGAVRRPEQARIRWQDPTDNLPESRYRRGLDVIVASIRVQNCALDEPVSLGERRDARPRSQPFIAAGSTPAGDTHWALWTVDGDRIGLQTSVDTTSAGFQSTPHYTAHVVGDRVLFPPPPAANVPGTLLDGFVEVAAPTAVGFVLRMVMPSVKGIWKLNPASAFDPADLEQVRAKLRWHVVWMGVEG